MCSVLQANLRRCSTCHLLQETAFQRPQLMRLKVKDLRQYLVLRNIPTDTCREKEDLVDLVLCHHGLGPEEDADAGSLRSSRSQTSGFFTHPFSMSVSSQGELANRRGSTGNGTPSRVQSLTCALWYSVAFLCLSRHASLKSKMPVGTFRGGRKNAFCISHLRTEDYKLRLLV